MRELFRLLRSIVVTIGLLGIAVAIVVASYVAYRAWTDTGSVVKGISAPFTAAYDYVRIVRGTKDHSKPPTPAEERSETIELAAAAIGRDSEGEDARFRREVMAYIYDTMLRNREHGISIPQNFRKAHTWLPRGWDHNQEVPLLTRWTTGWVDRELEKTRRTVPTDIMATARDIVKTRRSPDPEHCATVILRAEGTGATQWSGEKAARAWIVKNLKPDPILNRKGYRTMFFCQ